MSAELDAFLRYVHGEGVDSDPFVNDIRSEIRRLVQDPEWLEDFMTFEEELEAARYNAEKRGYDRGIQEGIEQGADRLAKSLTELGADASLVAKALELARDSREDEQ
ncbi:MAG: hypothetical protein Q4A01_06630 [Coriobacteriales bacterium]|nr:hypothetical protein [Coriobacteriales bacterium]